jgi:hypothetical protein
VAEQGISPYAASYSFSISMAMTMLSFLFVKTTLNATMVLKLTECAISGFTKKSQDHHLGVWCRFEPLKFNKEDIT